MSDSLSTAPAETPAPRTESPGAEPAQPPLSYIRPAKGWQSLELDELWRFRELFWIFAARDIKVRYKQTVLGAAWAIIQPLAFTVVGTVVFGQIAGSGTDNVKPAFLFYLVSQLPWMLFNTGLQTSAMSLVGAQNMIKKVYFPRLILPASAVMVSLMDFLVLLVLVALVLLGVGVVPLITTTTFSSYVPAWQITLVPVAALWTFIAALAVGLPLSALNVEYRDVRYVIPFVTQFMIFAAPVFWSVSKIPESWQALYALLPVAGPIDFFRWCILDTPAHPLMWAVGFVSTLLTFVIGLAYFKRVENTFADVV